MRENRQSGSEGGGAGNEPALPTPIGCGGAPQARAERACERRRPGDERTMKQRHSYSRLLFHLVFSTKARWRLIEPADEAVLREYIKNQRAHHAAKTEMRRWEPDETSP